MKFNFRTEHHSRSDAAMDKLLFAQKKADDVLDMIQAGGSIRSAFNARRPIPLPYYRQAPALWNTDPNGLRLRTRRTVQGCPEGEKSTDATGNRD